MRASVFMAGGGYARLRRRIAEIEAHGMPTAGDAAAAAGLDDAEPSLSPRRAGRALPFGIDAIDGRLGGGLRRNGLHELRCAESRNAAAATGFAAALLARLSTTDDRPVLWIVERAAADEAGSVHGRGLEQFGFDPRRLILVRLKAARDALWVFEEGLRCHGLSAVITEIRGYPRLLDLTASRRLALRAREHGVMGLLLRQAGTTQAGATQAGATQAGATGGGAHHADASTTRWLVAPRPATADADDPAGIGNPAWRLTLERNRTGIPGTFDVEWNHARRTFALLASVPTGTPHPLPVAPPLVDGSAASPDRGKVVALRPASPPAGRELTPREIKRRRSRAR
jgi:protein ImuA